MIYYFLPGTGIFGGIKMGYQLVDSLNALGVPACVASPEGEAAQWFSSQAPVVDRAEVMAQWVSSDTAIFSHPDDYLELRQHCDRLIFHCQGTDPTIDSFVSDATLTTIACWRQAHEYLSARGATPFTVGLGIPSAFFYSGEPKQINSLSFMPRRGGDFIERTLEGLEGWNTSPVDAVHELKVAEQLKRSSHFLASSPGEWFGLPALEALAAGCVVLSPEVLGGSEYLHHTETALVGDWPDLREFLSTKRLSPQEEAELSQRGVAMAHTYSMGSHRIAVARAIEQGVFS
jgi:hypothetical protein